MPNTLLLSQIIVILVAARLIHPQLADEAERPPAPAGVSG